jgi:DNA-binding beta-propeller fold protein YncE
MKRTLQITLAGASLLAGCTDTIEAPAVHFARPIATTVVCAGFDGPKPLSECGPGKTGTALAYVLNGDTGSVTRVRLSDAEIIDEDGFIPGYTPTQVGAASVSLAASPDGRFVFTADAGEPQLSRIDTTTLAVTTQALPAAPSNIVAAGDVLYVALPDAHAVARIPYDAFGSLAAIESFALPAGTPFDLALSADEQELWVSNADTAWVSLLDTETGAELRRVAIARECRDDLDNNGDGKIDTADGGCRTDPDGSEAVLPAPVTASLPLSDAVDRPECFDGLDNDGDGAVDYPAEDGCLDAAGQRERSAGLPVLSRIALSPDGATLYATNARERTIEVIDTGTASHVDVNAEGQPGANALLRRLRRSGIVIPGGPADVTIVDTKESASGNPTTTAVVTSSSGNVFFIDVTGADGVQTHRLRMLDATSSADLVGVYSPSLSIYQVTVDGITDGTSITASFGADDVVESLGGDRRPESPSFGEFSIRRDASGAVTSWYGVTVVGTADALLPNETWSVTNGGVVLHRTSRALLAPTADPLTFATIERPFCKAGVAPGDWLVLYPRAALGCDALGDGLVAYEIATVFEDHVTITPGSGKKVALFERQGSELVGARPSSFDPAPDPSAGCFDGVPLAYAIHTPPGQYLVTGGVSGALHAWIRGEGGACVQDPSADPSYASRATEWTLKAGAVLDRCPPSDAKADTFYEGTSFQNHAVSFRILPGCQRDLETGAISLLETRWRTTWSFTTRSGRVLQVPRDYATDGSYSRFGLPRGLFGGAPDGHVYFVDPAQNQFVTLDPSAGVVIRTRN